MRLQTYQVEALHREKLVSLGTLAAGLMHELHNPGSAAKRAASQLRENLMRLQELSLRSASKPKTPEQLECMHSLLEHAMKGCHAPAMSSMEQADAEEAMAEWLQAAGVENAFTIAPSLVGIGFEQEELECAREYFDASSFSDALNWLEALVSSVSLVCAIEESISRVSDLVMAVKKFAYDERSPAKELDVHDSLQSTLTILGHKLRIKQIAVEKRFEASPSTIHTRGSALSQVWTNLIDNAADASPTQSQIEIATWTEPANGKRPTGMAGGEHRRSRDGNSSGCAAAHLRGILYHQAAGLGHRAGPGDRAPHRDAEIRRQDRCGIAAGQHALHRAPAVERHVHGQRGRTEDKVVPFSLFNLIRWISQALRDGVDVRSGPGLCTGYFSIPPGHSWRRFRSHAERAMNGAWRIEWAYLQV